MRLQGPTTSGLWYSDTGGDGPVIVFLHGILMNGTVYSSVVEDLQPEYRCITPELPFGAHAHPMPEKADLSLGSLAILVAEFIKELQLENITLVCNDWGGAQLVIYPGGSCEQ